MSRKLIDESQYGVVSHAGKSAEVTEKGEFVRQDYPFKGTFGDKEGEYPVEPGRYRLFWSLGCPWSHRAVIVLKLLGLDRVISLGLVDPMRPNTVRSDWAFTLDPDGVDPVLKIHTMGEIYLETDPDFQGRFTVPAIVDIKKRKIVNNNFQNMTTQFEVAWKKYHIPDAPDLYPEALRPQIDEMNDILFAEVNNGVYRAGFSRSQEEYEKAYDIVFNRLDWLEERLSHSRYLFGSQITDSDVRLYVTLVRFDCAYYNGFMLNRNRLTDFPNLWAYARDLYQQSVFGETTNFRGIKTVYHLNAVAGNPYHILPKGPDESGWLFPHDRDRDYN